MTADREDFAMMQEDGAKTMTKSISEITLYELMAEDFSIHLGKNTKFGYNLYMEGYDNDSPEIEETEIHPAAIDSFAHICRRFLEQYERINKRVKNEEMELVSLPGFSNVWEGLARLGL
jgi:hypothetical protein